MSNLDLDLDGNFRINNYYWIKPRPGAKERFRPNIFQRQRYNRLARALKSGEKHQEIELKSRKFGTTTGIVIWILNFIASNPYEKGVTMAHTQDKSSEIFRDIVKFAWDRYATHDGIPLDRNPLRPEDKYNTKTVIDLSLSMGSEYAVTSDAKSITPRVLHASEGAYFPRDEDLNEAFNSIPENGILLWESTAHGVGNLFEGTFTEAWTARKKGQFHPFTAIFNAWWMDPKNRVRTIEGRILRYPQEAAHKMELALQHFGVMLTPEQLYWWDEKKQMNRGFMDQFYPTIPEEAFLQSGRNVFDVANLRVMEEKFGRPPKLMLGDFEIYDEPDPDDEYGIGVDTAEGLAHGDEAVICVVSKNTGREVACAAGAFAPHIVARMLGQVARYYDPDPEPFSPRHLIVIERNNHGHTVIALAKEDDYLNLYTRRVKDQLTEKEDQVIGWDTNEKSKGYAINTASRDLEERNLIPQSFDTFAQLSVYVYAERGKMGARPGKKDDRVIALTLADLACMEMITVGSLNPADYDFY